jgi:hypothetical protein
VNEHGYRIIEVVDDSIDNIFICNDDIIIFISSIVSSVIVFRTTYERYWRPEEIIIIGNYCVYNIYNRTSTTSP